MLTLIQRSRWVVILALQDGRQLLAADSLLDELATERRGAVGTLVLAAVEAHAGGAIGDSVAVRLEAHTSSQPAHALTIDA